MLFVEADPGGCHARSEIEDRRTGELGEPAGRWIHHEADAAPALHQDVVAALLGFGVLGPERRVGEMNQCRIDRSGMISVDLVAADR
jgi:hypothetical protein